MPLPLDLPLSIDGFHALVQSLLAGTNLLVALGLQAAVEQAGAAAGDGEGGVVPSPSPWRSEGGKGARRGGGGSGGAAAGAGAGGGGTLGAGGLPGVLAAEESACVK